MTASDATTTERLKEEVRKNWTELAPAWRKWQAKFRLMSRAATDALIEEARPAPGMRVLDLAGGTGEPALSVAEAVGPGGHVTCTDLVPEMLVAAEEAARERGQRNITFEQADAESLRYDDASFDLVVSRFGVMFFPDYPRALAGIRRVLKPGARSAFTVWAPASENPFFAAMTGVLSQYAQLPAPEPGTPTPFTFAEPGSLSAALRASGFRDVREERQSVPWDWPGTPEELWGAVLEFTPATRRLLEAVPADRRDEAQREVLKGLRSRTRDGAVRFEARIYVASAVA